MQDPVLAQQSNINYESVLTLSLQMGVGLLSCGASVSRVEATVRYVASAYDVKQVEVFAIPSMIIVTITEENDHTHTQMMRVGGIANDFSRMAKFNQLSRDIVKKRYTLEQAQECYYNIIKQPSHSTLSIIGSSLLAGAFAIFFGGTWLDMFPSLLIGAFMGYLGVLLSGRNFNGYARAFIQSLVGGVCSILLTRLMLLMGIESHCDMVIIGTIMIVVPGLLISNAIRDLFIGDIVSGLFQILNGLLITLAIVAGYGLSLFVLKDVVVFAQNTLRGAGQLSYYLYAIPSCLLSAVAFAFMCNVDGRCLPWALVNTAITYALYLVLEVYVHDIFINFLLATILAATLSEVFARIIKAPATIFLVPTIIPYVPGGALYYTMNYLVSGEIERASVQGTQMGLMFLGIAVGLSVVTVLFQLVVPVRRQGKILRN